MEREFKELPDSWTLIGDHVASGDIAEEAGTLPASDTENEDKEPINRQTDQEK